MKLNLGSGRDYRDGWQNWDLSREVKADAYLDVGKEKFPAKDDTFDEIYAGGLFNCILENSDFIHAMNECHRVLKKGGTLTFVAPSAKYYTAYRDPTEVRRFVPETFEYFTEGTRRYYKFGSIYGFKPWKFVSLKMRRFVGLYMWFKEVQRRQVGGLPSIFHGNMTVVLQKP